MPRRLRIQLPEHTYHITSRCIEWKDMMQEDYFKTCFVEILRKTKEKYDFKLTGFCIMDNHIHLVIHTTAQGAVISRIVQYIKARFAELYNKKTGRTGPFWNERYRDSIVQFAKDGFHYLLWLLWYIAFNPVRKRMCGSPAEYRYSSIGAYLHNGAEGGVAVDVHEYFMRLGGNFSERVRRFMQYEEIYRKRHSIAQWV